ncbi:MAG: hypothetical protein JNL70_25615 [Saprospiraceae bacterium]|nr:hypothetical protein [Saprospiraceae bacterium]
MRIRHQFDVATVVHTRSLWYTHVANRVHECCIYHNCPFRVCRKGQFLIKMGKILRGVFTNK